MHLEPTLPPVDHPPNDHQQTGQYRAISPSTGFINRIDPLRRRPGEHALGASHPQGATPSACRSFRVSGEQPLESHGKSGFNLAGSPGTITGAGLGWYDPFRTGHLALSRPLKRTNTPPDQSEIGAVITAVPRPNQAFWTSFSAMDRLDLGTGSRRTDPPGALPPTI